MADIQKSYYAVIPAVVRYDSRLCSGAKLLYGEITALCSEKGFCWAGNEYFAGLYGVTIRTIIRWVQELHDGGYIKINYQYVEGKKEIQGRCISLSDVVTKTSRGGDKNVQKVVTKMSKGGDKNVTDNNTIINNTKRNIYNVHFEKIWQLYPNKKGKGQVSDSQKERLYKIPFEEMERAVSRYLTDLEKDSWRKPQNGSTFFNSGYVDYLDENYSGAEQEQRRYNRLD